MTCAVCSATNSDGARFCSSCGAALALACVSCGAELAEDARFCSSCGTPVESSTPDGDGIERKVVSVLFADLAGFTASASDADPEDVAARLTAFHSAVREEIERFGGRIEKLIGDGVFAIFGAPVAHEDDAERAVRAALRLQETLADLNETSQLDLAVRVAVTTGEAMVRLAGTSQDQEGVVGDVVNTASRLQQLAPEGGVLVDQRTHAATHRVTDFVAQDPVTVKGKPDPIAIWVATGMRSRFGVGVDVAESAAFVGREDSLRLLVDSYERAVASETAQLVTIGGEPGVGKTRLVAEFRRVMDDREDLLWWRQGHCLPYGDGISFWALSEIVKAHAGVLDGEPTATVRDKVLGAAAGLLEDADDASWVGQRLLELIGVSTSESSREERFSAWTHFLETLAARNPLVLVIDDLHWADPSLVDFLDELVERVDDVPLLLVATARPELYDAHAGWGGGKRNSTTIALGPLSESDTAALVSLLNENGDASAVAAAVERSGGNPLYATELVRMAADRQASGDVGAGIPDSIQAVIAARIDLLPPEDKDLLQAAAVVGKVFWSGAISFITGVEAFEVGEALRRLSRRELVRRARRSSMRDQDEYSFWHDLVADVAYGQLPRQRRQQVHEAVGQWIEATAGERIGEVSEILAHHFGEALALSEAAGARDERLAAAARRHLVEAGQRAENVDAKRSYALLERALDLSTNPRDQAEVLLPLAAVGNSVLETPEAVALGTRAVETAALANDISLEAQAATVLSRSYWLAGEGEESHRFARHAILLSDELPEGPALTSVLSQALATIYLKGDFDGLGELIDRALDVGRRFGPEVDYLNALKWAGTFIGETEDADRGVQLLRQAHDGAVAGGHTRLQVTGANNLASFLVNPEHKDEAIAICEEAIAVGTARGAKALADFTRATLSEIYFHVGEWDKIVPQAEYLVDTYGTDNVAGQSGMFWLAQHHVFTKHPDAGVEVVGMLEMSRRAQDHQALVPSLYTAIEFHRQQGEVDQALDLVAEFEKATEGRAYFRAVGLAAICGFLAQVEEWDILERLLEGVEGGRLDEDPQIARGWLAYGRGDLPAAAACFETDADHRVNAGSPWQRAIALTALARVKIDQGDHQAGSELLDEATELLRVVGPSVFDDAIADQRSRLDR